MNYPDQITIKKFFIISKKYDILLNEADREEFIE